MAGGLYSIGFDRTGFPLVRGPAWDYAIALFPVSKYQFEGFLANVGAAGLTDTAYRELLALNPRRAWRHVAAQPWSCSSPAPNRSWYNAFWPIWGLASDCRP